MSASRTEALVRPPSNEESRRPDTKKVHFRLRAEPGSAVFVAGSFNDWNPNRHRLEDATGTGDYRATLGLKPGRFEYKFVSDGVWCVDPECPDWARNNYGSLNSVLTVE
jgi:1,4-alpha-glucan branching enzyme